MTGPVVNRSQWRHAGTWHVICPICFHSQVNNPHLGFASGNTWKRTQRSNRKVFPRRGCTCIYNDLPMGKSKITRSAKPGHRFLQQSFQRLHRRLPRGAEKRRLLPRWCCGPRSTVTRVWWRWWEETSPRAARAPVVPSQKVGLGWVPGGSSPAFWGGTWSPREEMPLKDLSWIQCFGVRVDGGLCGLEADISGPSFRGLWLNTEKFWPSADWHQSHR